jgi:hypothetical protein
MIDDTLIETKEQYCDGISESLLNIRYLHARLKQIRKLTILNLIRDKIKTNKILRYEAKTSGISNPSIKNEDAPFILSNIYAWLGKTGD